jgi:hypothetical protein
MCNEAWKLFNYTDAGNQAAIKEPAVIGLGLSTPLLATIEGYSPYRYQ